MSAVIGHEHDHAFGPEHYPGGFMAIADRAEEQQ